MARMLSTVDNPYDPRSSWDEWLEVEEIEKTIDRILELDGTNFYQTFEVED